ncbi:hypothetical protein QBC47DRAFT_403315 [Echria macrotheca]|uniref:Secreted protein n=1 Tax=Echria macrotheca TaxID=438768 RepID=A0AAJ0BDK8_9PEZI|nr:hypothetical protein QBC47DRAFT_403315 [Echria macrotheca]
MHLKLLFGLLPLFTAATALAERGVYVVPEDTAPGFYVVNFHDDGNSTLERVDVDAAIRTAHPPEKRGLLSTGSAKFSRHLTKRVDPSVGATRHYMTQQDQYNYLTGAWRDYFNGGGTLAGGHIWFIRTDQLVLAVCVYQSNTLSLQGGDVDAFNGLLDQQLGFWQTGWANYYYYTFWRDYRGYQICGNLNGGYVP